MSRTLQRACSPCTSTLIFVVHVPERSGVRFAWDKVEAHFVRLLPKPDQCHSGKRHVLSGTMHLDPEFYPLCPDEIDTGFVLECSFNGSLSLVVLFPTGPFGAMRSSVISSMAPL